MKKIKVTTPENIEVEYTLADIASRTAAAAIDVLIQSIILLIFGVGVFLILFFSEDLWEQYEGWILGASILLYGAISYGYFIFMELTMNGKTIGKKILKLRAIRNNGQSISLKHSAIRNLFRVFIDMFGIGLVLMFFSREGKRLGDYAASTIVVIEEQREAPITLDMLQKRNEYVWKQLSSDELEILREYYSRKNTIKNPEPIRKELKDYFLEKLNSLEISSEWIQFINDL